MAHPPELKRRAKELRKQGVLIHVIAVDLGVPKSTVIRWLNPALEKRGRARAKAEKFKKKRRCPNCGRRMADKSAQCENCYNANRRYWTRERIIEAIHAWVIEHGYPPTSGEWIKGGGEKHPAISSMTDGVDPPFRNFGEALTAAGYTPRSRRPKRRRAPLTEAEKDKRAALRRLAREEKIRLALEKENESDNPGSV